METIKSRLALPPATLANFCSDRPDAPKNVWNWQVYSTWRDVIWELIDDVVDEPVRHSFLASPPKYVVADDLSWLEDIIWSVHEHNVLDFRSLLTNRLTRRFRAFRAVHGTRTADLASFYAKGLLPLSLGMAFERARQIFLNEEFPELAREDLENALREVNSNLRKDRVFFEGNEKMLIDHCGHYMLYGSEYLIAIATHLKGYRDYRQVLGKFGQPTVFVCDVPLSFISERTLMEFAGRALAMVFQELLEGKSYLPDDGLGAGFCIHRSLPPDCIVGHYHPVVRCDFLTR